MWQFIKYVLATLTGLFVFLILSFLLLLVVMKSFTSEKDFIVSDNSVLKISLSKEMTERATKDDGSIFENLFLENDKIGLLNLKEVIQQAKEDKKIKGIYLDLDFTRAGFSSLQEIRNALVDFKTSGKWIIAYGEIFTERSYYIASVADHIYLNPAGELEFNGFSSQVLFFKGLLDKLHVQPEIFRAGEFKDAMEPFLFDKMSAASKMQLTALLNSLYTHYITQISDSRKIDSNVLKNIADSLLINDPQDALHYHLITNVGYADEVETFIRKKLTMPEESKINFVKISDYQKVIKETNSNKNKIAVIIAQGDIIPGASDDPERIASESIVKKLRMARKDSSVKAVVLRINSPGGSSLASEVIWREIVLTNKVKPVIASLSDYAASGGYYMAVGCKKIIAENTTITGSIGVFMPLFNIEDFLKIKLGVTVDRVNTNTYSDILTILKPLSIYEKKILQKNIDNAYQQFLTRVADGRNMTVEAVSKIASGRVWSGEEASKIGLVDRLGGFEDAVKLAAQEAKLGDAYQLKYIYSKKGLVGRLVGSAKEQVKVQAMKEELGDFYNYYQRIKSIKNLQGIQARMPFEMEIN